MRARFTGGVTSHSSSTGQGASASTSAEPAPARRRLRGAPCRHQHCVHPPRANHAQDAVRRAPPFDAARNSRPAELPLREEFQFRHQARRMPVSPQPRLRFHYMQQGNLGFAGVDQPPYRRRQPPDPGRQIDRNQHTIIVRHNISPVSVSWVSGLPAAQREWRAPASESKATEAGNYREKGGARPLRGATLQVCRAGVCRCGNNVDTWVSTASGKPEPFRAGAGDRSTVVDRACGVRTVNATAKWPRVRSGLCDESVAANHCPACKIPPSARHKTSTVTAEYRIGDSRRTEFLKN